MSKILLIGSLQNRFNPDDRGGVVILFELLLNELEQRGIEYEVIDTLAANYGGRIKTLVLVWFQILQKFLHYRNISLHATSNSFIMIAPLLVLMVKPFSKKISIRLFGGNFDDIYAQAGGLKKFIMKWTLKNADYVFFELKSLTERYRIFNENTYWFPNVRKKPLLVGQKRKEREYRKRFVYLGTINEEKGIDDLCMIRSELAMDITIDLYGPVLEEKYTDSYFQQYNISYKGALDPSKVYEVMDQYDMLVLPSYREGYPGVIIEAFALGMPVVATKLPGIMEMCTDGKNACLYEPGDRKELVKIIRNMDHENYQRLSRNAYHSFDLYDSQKVTKQFLEKIGFI